jgi:hypothetical protein
MTTRSCLKLKNTSINEIDISRYFKPVGARLLPKKTRNLLRNMDNPARY